MTQKQCFIIVAILMWVVLLWVWVYYWIKEYKINHPVICRIEQWWDCPENVLECYEDLKEQDILLACPAKELACKPIEVEVCR
jgi:hypothetical protein